MKALTYTAATEFLEFLEAWDIQATDMFSRRDLARAEKYRGIVKDDKGDSVDTDDVSDRIDSSFSGMSCPCSSFKTCRSIDGLQYCLSYLLLDRIKHILDSPCIPESLPEPPPSQCNELSDQARKDIEEAISDTIGRVETFLESAGLERSEGTDKESALAERATYAKAQLVTNEEIAEWRSTHVLFAIRQRLQFCKGLFQPYMTALTAPSVFSLRKDFEDDDASLFLGAVDPQCLPLGLRIDLDVRSNLVESILAYCEVLSKKDISAHGDGVESVAGIQLNLNKLIHRHRDLMSSGSNNLIEDRSNKGLGRSLAEVVRDGHMPKHMRILQWEILLRDIHKESNTQEFMYAVTSSEKKLSLNNDLLSSVSREFLLGLSDYALILTETSETGKGVEALGNINPKEKPFKEWRHKHQVNAHENFQQILEKVQTLNPNAFNDLIHTFGHRRSMKHLPLHPTESTLLLEDGEMTFFSILWVLRSHYNSHGNAVPQPVDQGPFISELEKENANKNWWAITGSDDGTLRVVDQLRFLYQLGLGMLVPAKKEAIDDIAEWEVITTQRASSFVQWLCKTALVVRQRCSSVLEKLEEEKKKPDTRGAAEAAIAEIDKLRDAISNTTCNSSEDELWGILKALSDYLFDGTLSDEKRKWRWNAIVRPFISCLPIKEYTYGPQEQRWILLLICFFLSDAPNLIFREWLQKKAYCGNGMTLEEAMKLFMPHSSWWALLATHEGRFPTMALSEQKDDVEIPPHRDQIVDRLCRSPYFPLEFLYRMYQPYPIQLLIMAQGFTPAPDFLPDKAIEEVPSSLAFITVAGWLPPMTWNQECLDNRTGDSNQDLNGGSAATSAVAMNWLSPLWELGVNLSISVAMPMIYEKTLNVGETQGIAKSVAAYSHEVYRAMRLLFHDIVFPLREVFSVDGTARYSDGRFLESVGCLNKVAEAAKALRLDDWLLCPAPSIFLAARTQALVYSGAGGAEEEIIREGHPNLYAVLQDLAKHSKCVLIVTKRNWDLRSLERIRTGIQEFESGIDKLPDLLPPESARSVRWGTDAILKPYRGAFTRAFLAAAVNCLRHADPSEGVRFDFTINPKHWPSGISLALINKQKPNPEDRHGGTKAAIKTALDEFGTQTSISVVFAPCSREGAINEDRTHWMTGFFIPDRVTLPNGTARTFLAINDSRSEETR